MYFPASILMWHTSTIE